MDQRLGQTRQVPEKYRELPESGGCYAGENHGSASPALRHGGIGRTGRTGDAGNTSYIPKTDKKKYRDKNKSQREMFMSR